jgi:hypothetical protein
VFPHRACALASFLLIFQLPLFTHTNTPPFNPSHRFTPSPTPSIPPTLNCHAPHLHLLSQRASHCSAHLLPSHVHRQRHHHHHHHLLLACALWRAYVLPAAHNAQPTPRSPRCSVLARVLHAW